MGNPMKNGLSGEPLLPLASQKEPQKLPICRIIIKTAVVVAVVLSVVVSGFIIVLFFAESPIEVTVIDGDYCINGDNNCWDMLGITVNWPETSCRQMNRSHHICHEPSNLDDWTIHGLWPNRMSGGWPQYCTREKFDPTEIKDLITEMDKDWPNLMQDRPHYDFWTHEYEKHGTCAETLEALSTEYKYFEKTLEIHEDMDIINSLMKSGIMPSNDQTYDLDDFIKGFEDITGGYECEIKCAEGDLHESFSNLKVQYIQEVMCCMDKSFNFIACPNSNSKLEYPNIPVRMCQPNVPIAYPKISHL